MQLEGMTLRTKLIAVFVLPALVLFTVYGVLAYSVARSSLEQELGARLEAVGQSISADMSGGVQAAQLQRLDPSKERTLGRLHRQLVRVRDATRVQRVFLFDRSLQALADSDTSVPFGQKIFHLETDRVEVERAFEQKRAVTSVLFTGAGGERYKYAYVPIFLDDARTQVAAVVGVQASASYFALLTNLAGGLLLISAIGLLAFAIIATLMARTVTRPVSHLVEAAGRLGQGDLDAPVVTWEESLGPRDELDFLARSFEEMRRGVLGRDRQMQMMLSGIAHEVRNPLGGMELFCGLLREDLMYTPEDTDEMLDKVDKIGRELTYLNKVVTDFLDFARHKPLDRERIEALELGNELAMLLYGQVEDAGCQLQLDVEPAELEITADRERLRRAIINTIRNAYQAASQAGLEGCVTLRMFADGDERVVEVVDQGPGISEEKLAEILTPFFTTKEKGSGLGLALTQKIIEQHGGRLEIDSELGQGTTVRFVLPWDEAIEAAQMVIPDGWLG